LDLFDTANKILETGLRQKAGKLVVPQEPGLGVEVNQRAVEELATQHWKIRSE